MTYIPGHSMVVMAKNEASNRPDLITTLPTTPTFSAATDIIGYCNVPEWVREEGGRKQRGNGTPFAVASGKGRRMENLNVEITVTSLPFLQKCLRGSDGASGLQHTAIAMALPGIETRVIRYAVANQIALSLAEEGDSELKAQVGLMGIATELKSAITQPTYEALQLGDPMYFHNLANVLMNVSGVETDFRDALMSFNLTYTNNLETKGIRYGNGDNDPFSRRPFYHLPHGVDVAGEMTFHAGFPEAMFTSSVNATRWGDIEFILDDTPEVPDEIEPRAWSLKAIDCIPTTSRQNAIPVDQQMNHSVSFLASNLFLTDIVAEEGGG